MERYLNLSENQLFDKIDIIQEKLQKAYSTSVGQEYINFLQNQIDIIQSILEEKEYVKNADTNSGLVMDTFDTEGTIEKTISQEEERKKEEERIKKKSSNLSKFKKVYMNDD